MILIENGDDECIGGAELGFGEGFAGKNGARSHGDVEGCAHAGVGVDGFQQVVIVLERAERAVPIHQRRMPCPLFSWRSGKTARRGGGKCITDGVQFIADVLVKAGADKGILDMQRLAKHRQVDGVHVVAMDPDLAHSDIGGPLSVYLGGRCPDMLGQVAQAGGGGAIGLEDGLVA